ncbi:MAG: hypothetical protein NT133_26505 [Alphaproteobacteria bacterium]|nr:hypothetical protein [Alphaproteobacteria bacterium]
MRAAAITLVCAVAAWLAWHYGGEAGEHLGFEELDPLPRLVASFAVLTLLERLLAWLPAMQKKETTDAH